jgi:hypothetical protein
MFRSQKLDKLVKRVEISNLKAISKAFRQMAKSKVMELSKG